MTLSSCRKAAVHPSASSCRALRHSGTVPSALVPELDEQCVVVELRDGRCLALRVPGTSPAGARAEAAAFERCLRLLAGERRREVQMAEGALFH
mmetsp:Transcript_104887/g.333844  ORF Transcript_104887/g.333844 Transcript_104887/m.333844 type:complete len:94 (-) Transcript_104887:70-351(-)